VDAAREDRLAGLARDAESPRGILGIGDDDVDRVGPREGGHATAHELATGFADYVSDEQQVHAANTRTGAT
jgi:hypothetical protein